MSGVVLVLVGALLCFAGVGSVHASVPAAGFAVGWFLAALFGAGASTALVVALVGAAAAWVLANLVFSVASFFLGGLAGAVIGAKLYFLLEGTGTSIVLGLIFVPAVAVIAGFVAHRYRDRALLWLTALGGSALVLSGLATISGLDLSTLHRPSDGSGRGLAFVLWLVVAGLGWYVQRRLFARRLHTKASKARPS